MSEPTQLRHLEIDVFKRSLSDNSIDEDVILWKDVETEVKTVDLDRREITIAYSSERIDRDGDVISQRGIDLKQYRQNPVVLFAHGGGRFGPVENQLPIGRSMKLFREREGDQIKSFSVDHFTEADLNPLGDTVYRMLTNKPRFLNTASIGFRPLAMEAREVEEGEPGVFFMPMNFKKTEKLEHSIVPVPANPDALVGARSAGIDLAPIKSWAEAILDAESAMKDGSLTREHLETCWKLANGNTKLWTVPDLKCEQEAIVVEDEGKNVPLIDDVENKGSTPGNPSGFRRAEPDTAWRAPTLRSFGVDGPFEDLPAARRSRIARHFAWTENMPPNAFGQLKLPHHRANDAAVVLRGVNAALAVLNGARGGVDIPSGDRQVANRHLNAHRRAFDQPPIELRNMDEAELKSLMEQFAREVAAMTDTWELDSLQAIDQEVETIIASQREEGKKEGEVVSDETKAVTETQEKKGVEEIKAKAVPTTENTKDKSPEEEEVFGDDTKEESFEFPSIKAEDEARKDQVEDQIAELRDNVRTLIGGMQKLVDNIKVAGESVGKQESAKEEKLAEIKESGDDVVLILDDEPETKNETPSGNVGCFIAEGMEKAVTGAIKKARGRLPN